MSRLAPAIGLDTDGADGERRPSYLCITSDAMTSLCSAKAPNAKRLCCCGGDQSLFRCPFKSEDCGAGLAVKNSVCTPCNAGSYASSGARLSENCLDCPLGKFANESGSSACSACEPGTVATTTGMSACSTCAAGKYPDASAASCAACGDGEYSKRMDSKCYPCGGTGMDCAGGGLNFLSGFWFDSSAVRIGKFDHLTPVFICANPQACTASNSDLNGTQLVCAAHAGGPLCAVCEEGFVPDAAATDGRCKVCTTSLTMRWTNKMLLLVVGAACFFAVALVVLTQPAPSLKIDAFLVAAHIRIVLRRVRKRTLRRLHERDLNVVGSTITRNESVVIKKLLDEGKIEEVVDARRRVALGANSAGAALAAVGATAQQSGFEDQFTATAVEALDDNLRDTIGEVDTDGNRGVGSAVADVAQLTGGGGYGPKLLSFVKQQGANVQSWFNPGQIKILMGNLQINASLNVVFAIPWPPIYTQFIELLNVFKLDIFKGFSLALPCLHSTHFMSLAMFVAMPLVLISVFLAAFGVVAAVALCRDALPRKTRSCVRKLPCGRYTVSSARTSAVKVAIIAILFIYPTICSNVFMTFKCVDLGASGSHMVADMAVECYKTEWFVWAGVSAAAIALYVVGIPVGLLLLLHAGARCVLIYRYILNEFC